MTRAEYLVTLEHKLQIANRLKKFVKHSELAESRNGAPTSLGMLRLEVKELKAKLGGSERREYQRLMKEIDGS